MTTNEQAAQIERIAAGISTKEAALEALGQQIGRARALGLRGDADADAGLDDLRTQRAELETELAESKYTLEALKELAEQDRQAALAEKRDVITAQGAEITANARMVEQRFEKHIRLAMKAVDELTSMRHDLERLDNEGKECGGRATFQGGPPPAKALGVFDDHFLTLGVDLGLERWREKYVDNSARLARKKEQEAATMAHIAEVDRQADARQAAWKAERDAMQAVA